uniref:Uncharacterized protein n=1 Tax=Anguilla anguilla TaxID=7936 RepID=A0A0E9QNU1_ANGAN
MLSPPGADGSSTGPFPLLRDLAGAMFSCVPTCWSSRPSVE